MSNIYKKLFESWELEDRAAQPKEFGNRRKANDKRFYKRQAAKAVRRHGVIVINEAFDDDRYEELITLKALLLSKKDMLLEKLDELDAILASLPI